VGVASKKELVKIGLSPDNIDIYTYWVDQEVFKPSNRSEAKKKLHWEGNFVVLFVGRFIEIKGMDILIEVAKSMDKEIYFAFIGDGPLSAYIKEASVRFSNVMFIGKVNNHSLPLYYNATNIVCVPSKYEEGFGRVIPEALSCGTPVLASNRGGIPEALDETVGICLDPTADNLRQAIETLYQTPEKLQQMQSHCREYALATFSEENAELVVGSYYG
jgi:glycosyltransferase involved in cell wall biosynthesis